MHTLIHNHTQSHAHAHTHIQLTHITTTHCAVTRDSWHHQYNHRSVLCVGMCVRGGVVPLPESGWREGPPPSLHPHTGSWWCASGGHACHWRGSPQTAGVLAQGPLGWTLAPPTRTHRSGPCLKENNPLIGWVWRTFADKAASSGTQHTRPPALQCSEKHAPMGLIIIINLLCRRSNNSERTMFFCSCWVKSKKLIIKYICTAKQHRMNNKYICKAHNPSVSNLREAQSSIQVQSNPNKQRNQQHPEKARDGWVKGQGLCIK